MKLPNDFSRCQDADCPLAEQCARYVQRMTVHGYGYGYGNGYGYGDGYGEG